MGGLLYKRQQNIENRPEDEIYQNIIPFNEKIPKDEFLCPNCRQLVPEVLSIHMDIKKIDFKCKICNKIYKNSQSYQSELLKNNYLFTICHYCDKSSQNNEDIFSYCYDCKFDFCDQCKPIHDKENIGHIKIIKINEKKNRCLEHFNENYNNFCNDCGENICEKSESSLHKGHEITKINKLIKDLDKKKSNSIKIIENKNKELLNIIKFNETIINCFHKQKNNYLYLKSLKNISDAFQREKLRDSNDLKFVLYDIDKEIKNSEKENEKLSDDKDSEDEIEIERQNENLLLNKKKLNDENLKCISKIKFNNLKEINLSENKIKNIGLLSNISLPYLELLNLSFKIFIYSK